MVIGRVHGTVVSTTKCQKLDGMKLLVVMPIDLDTFTEKGQPIVAVDVVGAGEGEVIIDHIDWKGKRIFEKFPTKE